MVAEFSRNLGVAFQILNDLKDWDGDSDNKLVAGQDVLAGPADAAAGAGAGRPEPAPSARSCWHCCIGDASPATHGRRRDRGTRAGELFDKAQVFAKAEKLVEKYRARAEAIADEVEPTELRELLYYLVDTVLDRQPPPSRSREAAAARCS